MTVEDIRNKEEIMDPQSHPLPEIHQWWPRLSARAKQRIEEHDGDDVPDDVREEIEAIVGTRVDPSARLSDGDRRFIRTQQEMVD